MKKAMFVDKNEEPAVVPVFCVDGRGQGDQAANRGQEEGRGLRGQVKER